MSERKSFISRIEVEGDFLEWKIKEIVPLVYCRDCIHRPVLKCNGLYEEWVEVPKWEHPPKEWMEYDYTCPFLTSPADQYNRRPPGNFFCAYGEESMSLDKAIEHGKEKREPYRGAKAIDRTCRNHGSDEWSKSDRTYHNQKKEEAARQREEDEELH